MKDKRRPKGFTLYTDLKPLVDSLKHDPMLKAMYNYICEGTEPVFKSKDYTLAWEMFKVKLDASLEYHENRVSAGRKGGYAKAKSFSNAKQSLVKPSKAKIALATRQDRTRQDCLNNQPCSFPEGELTADMMEEYEKLNAELEEDEDE